MLPKIFDLSSQVQCLEEKLEAEEIAFNLDNSCLSQNHQTGENVATNTLRENRQQPQSRPERISIDEQREVFSRELRVEDAENYKNQGDFEQSASIYQALIELQPNNAFLYNKIGQLEAQLQDWSGAINSYRKALDLGINNCFWTYKNLSDALRKENRLDEAISVCQQAISIESDNPDVYDSLAQAYSLQRDYPNAILSYQKALDLSIKNPFWTYKNLSDALRKENRLDEADSIDQEALKLQPNKSSIATQVKEIEKQAENVAPDNNWLDIHNQGDEYFKQEKWEEAISSYKQAIELNPDYVWSYCNISRIFAKLRQFEDLKYYCNRAIAINPNYPEVCGYIGDIFAEQQQWDRAINYYRKAISIDQSSVPLSIFQNYNQALEAQRNQQIRVKVRKSELKSKLDKYHHLIAQESGNYSLYQKMADNLVELGEINKAIVFYKLALQINPQDMNVSYALNSILLTK